MRMHANPPIACAEGKYLPRYRTPCWTPAAAGGAPPPSSLRCQPGAYLLGAFHSGATSLGEKLTKHPAMLTGPMTFGGSIRAAGPRRIYAQDKKMLPEARALLSEFYTPPSMPSKE